MEPLERRKRILVVDDEAPLARTLKMRLEGIGYEVLTAATGREALTYTAECQLDLVVLDVNLPDMNGYQVARELRRIHHPWALPILMLTVKDKPIDQLRGFAHGADAYLTKPFESTELFQAVALLTGEIAAGHSGF